MCFNSRRKTVHAFAFRAEQAHTCITRKRVTEGKEIGSNVVKEERNMDKKILAILLKNVKYLVGRGKITKTEAKVGAGSRPFSHYTFSSCIPPEVSLCFKLYSYSFKCILK